MCKEAGHVGDIERSLHSKSAIVGSGSHVDELPAVLFACECILGGDERHLQSC